VSRLATAERRHLRLCEPIPQASDLPVLLPVAERMAERARAERAFGFIMPQLKWQHGVLLGAVFVFATGVAEAQNAIGHPSIVSTLLKWTPVLFGGFLFNLAISVLAMAIGTGAGVFLGLAQISILAPIRKIAWFFTHFFRNAPWLVLLFFCMLLLPFQVKIYGVTIPLPDWIKATFGLALPVMANVSEIVRGAIQSIPTGQWESAGSLAFTRRQTIWMIILPQCIKRMLPPWMNLYAILAMDTVLASVVGVSEVMTLTGDILGAENNRPELILPFYSYILIWFFLYCYPIARLTVRLERKFAVNI
jgi:polar amino acid transport system permease protein